MSKAESCYLAYKRIKKSLSVYSWGQYNVGRVSAFFLAEQVFFSEDRMAEKLKRALKYFFLVPKLNMPRGGGDIYLWSVRRNDYRRLARGYKEKINKDFESLCLSGSEGGWVFKFSPKLLFISMLYAIRSDLVGWRERVFTVIGVYAALNYLEFVERRGLFIRNSSYILSFNSSFKYESLVCLYARKYGVKTRTLQHGMYFKYLNSPPFDVINYENVCADEMLCWGRYTIDQIQEHVPCDTALREFGHPFYPTCKYEYEPEDSLFLVVLPRKRYVEEILSLLRILDSVYSLSFSIRLHPSLDVNDLHLDKLSNPFCVTNSELTMEEEIFHGRYSGVVGFNTTALFEVAALGLTVHQFISSDNEFVGEQFLLFKDEAEFVSNVRNGISPCFDENYYFGSVG